MKAAWKKKWIKALRSGEYKQAKNELRSLGGTDGEVLGYCCLGVLCDIANVRWKGSNCTYGSCDLNRKGQAYFGLDAVKTGELIHLNDTLKKSFKQIANHIEKHL